MRPLKLHIVSLIQPYRNVEEQISKIINQESLAKLTAAATYKEKSKT